MRAQELHNKTADLLHQVSGDSELSAWTEGNTCASSRATTIQDDLAAGSHSVNADEKNGQEPTANLTPAGSGSTKNLLMSYEQVGWNQGGYRRWCTHIVQNIIYNLYHPFRIQVAMDVTRPNY